ncbi:MAG: hypothetical protein MHPSP_004886, partial [Paramarteilia canceri]
NQAIRLFQSSSQSTSWKVSNPAIAILILTVKMKSPHQCFLQRKIQLKREKLNLLMSLKKNFAVLDQLQQKLSDYFQLV